MARVPSKHSRDPPMDFNGFLNDLQDWELSMKDKDKKIKPRVDTGKAVRSSRKIEQVDENSMPSGKYSKVNYSSDRGQYDYSRKYDAISRISSSLMTDDESSPDAASEKELGNEYFKQKKYKEAIDCYSRSIALSPTAVAYANRAMAYLKLKRFQEAEDDCTDALNLDDRYIKAYSRRATARKELGKLRESLEDANFALRLEPNNQEIKKQYIEAKALHDKAILDKVTGDGRGSAQGVPSVGKLKVEGNRIQDTRSKSNSSQKTGIPPIQEVRTKENGGHVQMLTPVSGEEIGSRSTSDLKELNGSHVDATQSFQRNHTPGNQELKASVQELAYRAASRSKIEAAKTITPPNSAYEFEVSWRGFCDDRALQARFLKAISPNTLPQIFKNALSTPILVEIVKCIATFFTEEMELAVSFLENFPKVSRFDMIIMCLTPADRADLSKIWNEILCNKAASTPYAETLGKLQSRYGLKR